MAEGTHNAHIDLEKELTCSICTDVLFQPLTLLDCLHTFCGACLKEWFLSQASSATSLHPYTCPSCRASVRGTKANATVTTLLDMFLHANPGKGKTTEEQDEQRRIYKPGDNVLPRLRRRAPDNEDDEDRRVLDEVRELSLREVGVSTTTHSAEPRESRRRGGGHSREPSRDRTRARLATRPDGQRSRTASRAASRDTSQVPPRQVEHQASLRSLLSASEVDPRDLEEEIMRQIEEEGLLDGIDLNNVDAVQENEISERIAEALRRRHEDRRRERRERDHALAASQPAIPTTREAPPRSVPTTAQNSRDRSRPPNRVESRHQRTASAQRPIHSSSDLPPNPTPSAALGMRRRSSAHERSPTEMERQRVTQRSNSGQTGETPANTTRVRSTTQTIAAEPRMRRSPRIGSSTFPVDNQNRRANHSSPSLVSSQPAPIVVSPQPSTPTGSTLSAQAVVNAPTLSERPRATSATAPAARPTMYTEPSISCNRCGLSDIQYEVYYNCQRCQSGNYNLCLRCYRHGKGCLQWYGFGRAAMQKYKRLEPPEGYPQGHEEPHVLIGHRYLHPTHATLPASHPSRLVTDEDPAKRLQSGVFCDICSAFANSCYWKCDSCNEGAWGFCNDCVNTGHHCTHPLLPLKQKPASPAPSHLAAPSEPHLPSPPSTPKSATFLPGPNSTQLANSTFYPLTFTTKCNRCSYPISPSHSRFHCSSCDNGDYDLCSSCYSALAAAGRVSPENGVGGWRRCPSGHRMVVVGFEDRDGGQRRVVVRDLVGGHALREDGESHGALATPNWSWRDADGTVRRARSARANVSGLGRFPPDSGVGMRVLGEWGYFPADGVVDELMFPRGAEVREVEDINGDWFWGVYAGAKGLFPGNYVRYLAG
ncbi:hypothetical protein EJ06DRAFT_408431 [Trichodelitschia bisporula]|uniref:RING-type domain-containing protein n=1 Tax=Trichodelitschia bisporula TaxID=703511 RepID=A0A6G1HXU4_9PEZI|nr:hypothetical protein EJ06DRAFT_408431 [Trichodelitschia bisporula]